MDRRIADIYDAYTNGCLGRRAFLKKLAHLAGGTAAAYALLPKLEKNDAMAEVISKDDPRLHTEYVRYAGETGDVIAYTAQLKGRSELPGVIVIHENTGLQPHIEDVTRRVALEGFLAIAPDALSPLGGTPGNVNQARSLLQGLDEQATVGNYVAAVQYLKTHPRATGKVGCMGFCWGGGMTNQVAVNSADLTAAVPFYGSQPASEDVPNIRASLLCHYGSLDDRINAGIEAFESALRAASVDYGIYMHQGADHAFFNDTRADRHNKEAAELAWRLTIAFFKGKLKDYRLVAHYKLDETEGDIASDSAGRNHGAVRGDPVWQRDGGKIGGALQFDGFANYIDAPTVLNPADGAFSAFAWIKGGAPGQVIMSQQDGAGAGWIGTDPSQGRLLTDLVPPAGGRSSPSVLRSEFVVTDDQWRHVGFAWDGSRRYLYVDGAEVARDAGTLTPLKSSDGGLRIGVGEELDAGSFWAGLIDDVRIYNQALSADEIERLAS
jgi:carboxymethylenebutenolidase